MSSQDPDPLELENEQNLTAERDNENGRAGVAFTNAVLHPTTDVTTPQQQQSRFHWFQLRYYISRTIRIKQDKVFGGYFGSLYSLDGV